MLTPIPNTGAVQKQITLDFSATNNTILYTVPEGKTCTGTFVGKQGSNGSVNINGTTLWLTSSGSATTTVLPAVLAAGTVVRAKGSDGNSTFVGVEQ